MKVFQPLFTFWSWICSIAFALVADDASVNPIESAIAEIPSLGRPARMRSSSTKKSTRKKKATSKKSTAKKTMRKKATSKKSTAKKAPKR